jgi:hypothetical protein
MKDARKSSYNVTLKKSFKPAKKDPLSGLALAFTPTPIRHSFGWWGESYWFLKKSKH